MRILSGFKLKYREGGLLNMSTINYINNREFKSWEEHTSYVKMLLVLSKKGKHFTLSELRESEKNPSIISSHLSTKNNIILENTYCKEEFKILEKIG